MRDHRGDPRRKRFFRTHYLREKPRGPLARWARRWYWLANFAWVGCIAVVCAGMGAFYYGLFQLLIVVLPWTTIPIFTQVEVVKWVAISSLLTRFAPLMFGVVLYFLFLRGYVATLVASYGRCAACGYEIMNVTPEPDGCTVCPECGGAWRCREAG